MIVSDILKCSEKITMEIIAFVGLINMFHCLGESFFSYSKQHNFRSAHFVILKPIQYVTELNVKTRHNTNFNNV